MDGAPIKTMPLYQIKADRIIDFSATYTISDADGQVLGAIRQQGMRSIWRSRYEILRDDNVVFTAREENPWSRVANAWLEGIPLIGLLSGYVFHPTYLIAANDIAGVVRVEKQAAFWESVFSI